MFTKSEAAQLGFKGGEVDFEYLVELPSWQGRMNPCFGKKGNLRLFNG